MRLPRFLQLEPVGQCNLRCGMCPSRLRRDGPPYGPPAMMDFALFARLVDACPGLEELQLQGLGEPLLHPRYFDMVAYAAGKGIRVSSNSNLTLLDAGRSERLVRSGLDTLHISIDASTPETYARIRVRGDFGRTLANVEGLLAAGRRLGRGPKLRLVMVIMRENLAELPGVVRLAGRLGIRAMFVQHLAHDFGESSLPARYRPMREYVEAQTLLNEDAERVALLFEEGRRAAREEGVELRLPETRRRPHSRGTPGRERCDWPWKGAYVSYQGLAMPCCMVATPDRSQLGDMARDGFEAVWNGAPYAEFRRALDSDSPPEICRSCSVYSSTF